MAGIAGMLDRAPTGTQRGSLGTQNVTYNITNIIKTEYQALLIMTI